MVPVVDKNRIPLMPCSEKRAKLMVNSRKATYFWFKGIYCIRLNVEPSERNYQDVVVGIDTGSKKEGYTIKSEAHTYLNIQADAVTHVKETIETRREMRRGRRFRKTPCRKNKANRSSLKQKRIPPSTKARWSWKLRVINWLIKIFPITDIVVEDIKAKTKGKKKWDQSFSPLEVGKFWFYEEIRKLGNLTLIQGYETKRLRDVAGLKKLKGKRKMDSNFYAHCVDSWVMANSIIGGHILPENTGILCITPIRRHHRQLHAFQPSKGGRRRLYGGTRSMGLKRGSLVT